MLFDVSAVSWFYFVAFKIYRNKIKLLQALNFAIYMKTISTPIKKKRRVKKSIQDPFTA